MPQYRIYHLDGAGRVSSAERLEAAGDKAAINAARDNNSVQCELWQGRRLVTRLPNGPAIGPKSISPAGTRPAAPPGA